MCFKANYIVEMYLDIYVYIVAVGSHDLRVPYVECSPLTTSSLFVSRYLYHMVGCWMAGRWSAEQLGSPGVQIRELIARTELTLDRLELHSK